MKLAEALVLRADIQKRVLRLRSHMQQSALVQEGETPPEDPLALLVELNQLLDRLVVLVVRINKTNLQTRFSGQETLTDALARRDVLTTRYNAVNDLASAATIRVGRHGLAEIRQVATVDVATLRRQADDIARQRRELDTAIQMLNWTSDLIES